MTADARPGHSRYRYLLVGGSLVVLLFVALTLGASGQAAAATTITTCTEINATNAPADGHVDLGGDITDSAANPCLRINASDIVLDGNGHTIDGTGSGTAVAINPASGRLSNVTVQHLVTTDWRESITALQSDNITIVNVTTSPDRTGILIDDGSWIVIRDSTITEGDTTLEFTDVTDGLVENMTITGFRSTGVDTSGSANVSVIGSTFRDAPDGNQALRLNADGGQILNNTVSNLTDDTGGTGISVNGDGLEIRNNTIVDVTGGALNSFNNEGNTIADNVLRRAGRGLYVGGQSHTVTNNTITDSQRGLSLGEGSTVRPAGVRNVVRQNTMANNTENFDPSVFDPADVDGSNTVEGRPIHYVTETSDVMINGSQPVGYVYAYGIDGLEVRDITLENASVTVSKSANVSIRNVTAFGDGEGIYLIDAVSTVLSDLDVDGWEFGLRLEQDDGASNMTVTNSTLTTTENDAYAHVRSATERALYARGIQSLTVSNTTVVAGDSDVGMDLTSTENASVSGNDVAASSVRHPGRWRDDECLDLEQYCHV
ncbi:MAG: right-handed parallel beta-helix repeat-containing protein [Natrialbaceae archaeon]|nr:right-handed parallel beta-helix repeat-containing protein [Natrialbaceae archaeon]